MRTKTIVLGKQTVKPVSPKPIEFVSMIDECCALCSGDLHEPTSFKFIELVAKKYGNFHGEEIDLMFCYNNENKRQDGVLYLGHWNDGVI